jgi:spermidine synthase
MMKNNHLIYSTSDSFGPIEVYENQVLRSLHFGTRARQSAMYVGKPYLLPLSYSRYMLAPLLFLPKLNRVLILGFGAGSLFHFFHHYYRPGVEIDAVELRHEVIDVAKRYFHLSDANEGLNLHIQPALEYLKSTTQNYDLVLVDIYNDKGVDRTILEDAFFQLLRQHTASDGLISINLWSSHAETFKQVQANLQRHFPHCLYIPVPNKGNIIIVAGAQAFHPSAEPLMTTASTLQQRLSLEFTIILNQIRKYNRDK